MSHAGPRILVVDDDPAIRVYLRKTLMAEGYRVHEAACGRAALRSLADEPLDLLILGLELSDMDGISVIRLVRERSPLPIVALSSRDAEEVVVDALGHGADDCIRKPFGIRELVARVRNALRRTAQAQGKTPLFVVGDLEVDLLHRRVHARGLEVHLSKTEYEVLRLLVEGGGKVLTHRDLLEAVWGPNRTDRVSTLRVVVRALRRKIETNPEQPRHILTETRVGYRVWVPAVQTRSSTVVGATR